MASAKKTVKPQAERKQQFIGQTTWGHYAISGELIVCAENLLERALRQRGAGFTTPTSHVASQAIGAVVLIATAFDAWLNEICDLQANRVHRSREFAAETTTTVDKFAGLLRTTDPSARHDTRDLELLTAVRHEIVHYLPRPTPTEGHVADVLADLDNRGLLLVCPGKVDNWEIPQTLASYALAYWAFRAVEAAVICVHSATPADRHVSIMMARNFTDYRAICAPEDLAEYDNARLAKKRRA